MKTETLRRWLWRFFLFWTALAFVVLPFDLGAAQIKVWVTQPGLQSFLLAMFKVSDAVWLVLAAATVYFHFVQCEGLKAARRAALVLLLGSGLALGIGVQTGLPFGPFTYTAQLGARIFGVPFSAPLLWLVIIGTSRYTILHFWEHARRWQIALGTGALVLITDLGLEWVAWRIRGYWLWYFPLANTPEWPPWQNFLTWFVLATGLVWLAFPAARPAGRQVRPVIILLLINGLCWLTLALRLGR